MKLTLEHASVTTREHLTLANMFMKCTKKRLAFGKFERFVFVENVTRKKNVMKDTQVVRIADLRKGQDLMGKKQNISKVSGRRSDRAHR